MSERGPSRKRGPATLVVALAFVAMGGCAGNAPTSNGSPDLATCATLPCGGCRSDAECAGNADLAHCLVAASRCVACLVDGDCRPGAVCMANRCVAGCSAGHACAPDGGVCEADAGACVDCLTDGD